LEVSSPLELLEFKTSNAKTLKGFYNEVIKEINEVVNNWRKYAEVNENKKVVFLELKTKFAIQSPISTMLSIKNPNYTLIIFKKKDNLVRVSLRRQDGKVNCGKLAEFATKNLKNAGGGGHIPAAGANIMTKDLDRFKENVLKYSK